VLGGLRPLSTLKTSSRDETFPHTYKLTTRPFHNRCGITLTRRRRKEEKEEEEEEVFRP
jgi:hypothetical protein